MSDLINRHKIFFGIIVFLMVLVIPLTLIQVQTQQNLKQRASEIAAVSVTLNPLLNSPSNPELNVNEELPVTILINNLSNQNISAIDISLTYPLDLLSFVNFQPASGNFTPITTEPGNGSFHFAAVNPGDVPIIDSLITVGTLQFKAKAKGTAKVKFSAVTITASGSTSALGVDATAEGTYIISDPATVVVAPTNTPTPTPTPTPIPNLFSCVNQIGNAKGNYQCAKITNGSIQCPSGYGDYSPSAPYTGTSCDANQGCCKQGATVQPSLFSCQDQAGTYAGDYICADIVNESTQCPNGFTNFTKPDKYTGTSCGPARGCCKKNPPVTAPTATPTPVVAVATCIKLIDVNSLARKYTQRDPTVTLQMVNNKARQYKQNPCP